MGLRRWRRAARPELDRDRPFDIGRAGRTAALFQRLPGEIRV
jgi:hypothetical protein